MSSQPDLDSAGGKAGLFAFTSARTYVGAGVVIEYLLSSEDAYRDDYVIYPEFVFALAF